MVSDAGHENSQSQFSQQHHQHHSQTNANSALMLVRFLNCLGKAAVGIVYYVDCTVKDELLRRKEARQSSTSNVKSQLKPKKSTKTRTKRKKPDEDDENPSNDTTTNSSNLTVIPTNTPIDVHSFFFHSSIQQPINRLTTIKTMKCVKYSVVQKPKILSIMKSVYTFNHYAKRILSSCNIKTFSNRLTCPSRIDCHHCPMIV